MHHICEWLGDLWAWYKPTDGEIYLGLACTVMAFMGAIVGYEILSLLVYDNANVFPINYYQIWAILTSVFAVSISFLCMSQQFGERGLTGIFKAIKGGLIVTFLYSLIAGTLVLPLWGTMFGPFAFIMLFVTKPFIAFIWVGSLLTAHMLMCGWRVERELQTSALT